GTRSSRDIAPAMRAGWPSIRRTTRTKRAFVHGCWRKAMLTLEAIAAFWAWRISSCLLRSGSRRCGGGRTLLPRRLRQAVFIAQDPVRKVRMIWPEEATHDQGQRDVPEQTRRPVRPRLLPRQAHAAGESAYGRELQVLHGG